MIPAVYFLKLVSQLEAGSFWPVALNSLWTHEPALLHISMNMDEHGPQGFPVIITSTPKVWGDHPSLFLRLGEVFGAGSLPDGRQCCSI